jgi:hypothetical protein
MSTNEDNTEQTNEQPESTVPTATTEDVINDIIEGAYLYSAAIDVFAAQFIFQGKSLNAHSTDLLVHVPDELTPEDAQKLFTKLARKIQKASHYYAIASGAANAMSGGAGIKKADIVTAIVQSYDSRGARRPAGAVIDKIADSYMKDTKNSKIVAGIVKHFWRTRLDSLIETRKCVEQASISLGTQMKYLEHDSLS